MERSCHDNLVYHNTMICLGGDEDMKNELMH